jgi:hypothetical protein
VLPHNYLLRNCYLQQEDHDKGHDEEQMVKSTTRKVKRRKRARRGVKNIR